MFLAAFLLALAYALGYESNGGKTSASSANQQQALPTSTNVDFRTLDQILSILKRDYFAREKLDDQALYQAAIKGMLDSLASTGTFYVDPNTIRLSVGPSGSFEGIGATVSQQGQDIVVVTPFKGSPAEAAGIKAGDAVLAVDGESTQGWAVDKAVLKIRGPKGTKVTLSIRHKDSTTQEITVTRDEVHVNSVGIDPPGGALHDANGAPVTDLAYMSISEFTQTTPGEVRKVAGDAENSGKKGLIIDLRVNPGGLLQETVDTADLFLEQGVILTEEDRNGNQNVYRAHSGGAALHIPIVILVDEFSASGSEVLTAALKDNGRATVIGEKSFGKGTVNVAEPLRDGGALYVVIRKWLTPAGVQIDGVGITPDVQVTPGPFDPGYQPASDGQLARAIDYLHGLTTGAQAAPSGAAR